MKSARYIDNQEDLEILVESLLDESLLAVDTESNSLYAYQERVCLIQLSTRTRDYIIDPLAIGDMSLLGKLMAAEHIEKVFHAAEYDLTCLKRDFGYEFRNLFDTMIAARICGLEPYGLGTMLETFAGVALDKSHQIDDWGARPLKPESLRYAQCDTHYLPYLRDELLKELKRQGRIMEATEAFADVAQTPAAAPREFDPFGFWRVAQSYYLKAKELRILREIYRLREDLAQKLDCPPNKVLENRVLIALATEPPATTKDLRQIKGINADQVRSYGKALLGAVKAGLSSNEKLERPHYHAPDPIVTERYTALHTWRKERAIKRGVESDVIISRQALWDLAYKDPRSLDDLFQIQGIGPWRAQTYGQEIIAVLDEFRRQ